MNKKIHIALVSVSLISLVLAGVGFYLSNNKTLRSKSHIDEKSQVLARIDKTTQNLALWEKRFKLNGPALNIGRPIPPEMMPILKDVETKIKQMDQALIEGLQKENSYLKQQIQSLYNMIDSIQSNGQDNTLPLLAILVSVLAMLPSWVDLYRKANTE